jgi:GGDEF domain-containing protein
MIEENSREIVDHGIDGLHLLAEAGDFWPEVERALKEVLGLTVPVSIDQLPLQNAGEVQCFVVAAETEGGALKLLRNLRRHLTHGLLPVILIMPSAPENIAAPYYDALLIAPFSPYQLKKAFMDQSRILTRCHNYAPLGETFNERAQREIQLFRFFHSRDLVEAEPQRDKESPLGYSIPWADDLLLAKKGDSLLELNHLATNGLFFTELQDRINICPQCHDYRINFRQVCPHCGSPDVSTQATIQHFTCAHVAPEKNFIQNGKYICPKCGKQLKHIGVDYTKPGEVLVCEHCGAASQEAKVSCLSIVCGAVFPPEQANQVSIHQYRLSQMGLEAAVQGFYSESELNNILNSFLNIYTLPFFKKYLQLEMQRSKRYNCPFSLINLQIANLASLDKAIGLKEKTNLIKELGKIFGTCLRNTDLISSTPEGNIYLLLIDCNELRAESTLQRILKRSKEVLSVPLEFKYQISCISDKNKSIENVQQLLDQVTI